MTSADVEQARGGAQLAPWRERRIPTCWITVANVFGIALLTVAAVERRLLAGVGCVALGAATVIIWDVFLPRQGPKHR